MTPVHEARFYEPLPDKKVLCTLCPHDCRIPGDIVVEREGFRFNTRRTWVLR
jgi:hypothetical protein